MKIQLITITLLIINTQIINNAYAQHGEHLPAEFRDKIGEYRRDHYLKCVKRLMRTSLHKFDAKPKLYARKVSNEVEYKIIPSMIISERAVTFDSSDNILSFLEFNKATMIEKALVFKQGNYIGNVDCSSEIMYGGRQDYHRCTFDDALEYQEQIVKAWNIIKEKNPDFVFSVRYIRNCWWFISDNKCKILDLSDLRIYDANEFLKMNCTINNIREFSKGNNKDMCI